MLTTIIAIVHILAAIVLIIVVLLQTGKGSDLASVFGGGGGQALFGSAGAMQFIQKATTVCAIIFMCTCLALAYLYGHRGGSIIKETAPPIPQTMPISPQEGGLPENVEQDNSAVLDSFQQSQVEGETQSGEKVQDQTGFLPVDKQSENSQQ